MARVGQIVGGATRLLVERPGAVLAWGLAFLVGIIIISALNVFGFAFILNADEASPWLLLVVNQVDRLLAMLLFAMVGTGVFRAVIWREENRWFSLRLGVDEWRVFVLLLVLSLLQMVAGFFLALLSGFAASLAGLVSAGNETVFAVLLLLLQLVVLGLLIWVSVRLSPVLPLAVVRRRISIDGAWDLTRGRFWPLFGGYFLVLLIALAITAALMAPFFGELFVQLLGSRGNAWIMQYAVANFAFRQYSAPWPVLVGEGLAVWFAITLFYTLNIASIAAATRNMLVDEGELEEDELY